MNTEFISGQYDWGLVVVSYVIAGFAAYVAITVVHRVFETAAEQWRWLILGALAMGCGIWSMHMVGMQAFAMPIPVGYAVGKTVASLLAAIAVASLALYVSSREQLGLGAVLVGALLMGAGICVMHYMGMAAMEMSPAIQYDPGLFSASVIIAVAASGAALWILFNLRRISRHRRTPARLLAAAIMAAAISGMHYTGMAAANFPLGTVCGAVDGLGGTWTTLAVAVFSLLLAGVIAGLVRADAAKHAHLREQRARREDEDRARFLSLYDPQTKLPNRASFQQEIVNFMSRAKRSGVNFDLYYCSVNFPGEPSDEIIDDAIDGIAKRLRAGCQPGDFLARYARQEFVFLRARMHEHDAPEAVRQTLRVACSAPIDVRSEVVSPQSHIGFAQYPSDGDNSRTLLFAATRSADATPSTPTRGRFALVR